MGECKVLLVDDEITIIEGFRKLFDWEKYGCKVIGDAMDGISAVKIADLYQPDLIIMDINLPMLDGLDTIREIQKKHAETIFIVVSGYDDFKYCQEALRLNVKDFILKPVDFEGFGEVIENVLKGKQRERKPEWEEKKAEENLISQILLWIDEHIQEDISLNRLSEEFHFNSSYFSLMFKREVGVNFHTYLSQIRVNKAKYYLTKTDKSVSEIASLVGFSSYRVFTKTFKQMTGLLPSQYEQKINRK